MGRRHRSARGGAALLALALVVGAAAPAAEPPPRTFTPRYSAPEYLERTDWPVLFDLPSFGVEHQKTAVVTELTTGHRQYQTAFVSRPIGVGPVCCIAQLWVEEGRFAAGLADLPLPRLAEHDAGGVVRPRREGTPGRIEEPALRYLPFTGPFGGDTWGCFIFLSDVITVRREGVPTPLVHHGYFCRRGSDLPDERLVAAVMRNLKMRSE